MTIEEDDLIGESTYDDETSDYDRRLIQTYKQLYDVTMENIPDLWIPLEFALSVKTINNIQGCTLPFGGILLGVPGSLKTVVIELFRGLDHTFYSDSFTPKAFVSHNSAVKKEKLKDIDMLPKIKDKFFLAPELAPIFSSEDKDLLQLLGILTRVLDGHGFESDSGAQGHRACKGEYMFTMLGAAVDIPHKVYKHLSALGPKLYFLRLQKIEHNQDYYLKNMKESFQDKIEKIRVALHAYLACFDANPDIIRSADDLPPKIPMNFDKNEELACKHIIQLAQLLGPLRAAVPTWKTEDTQGSSYAYAIPNIEEPSRAITILRNLAAGHALSQGRDYITIEDVPMLIQVVLSTASLERSKIFDLLISNNGYLKTRDVVSLLNTTPPTARRAMTELKAVGLVTLDDDVVQEDESDDKYGRRGLQMTLKQDYKWFLSKAFLKLQKGDTSEVVVEEEEPTADEKEKSPSRITYYDVDDWKEIPPPRSVIQNLVYDYTINKKSIFEGGILTGLRGGGNSFSSPNEPPSTGDNSVRKHVPYWCQSIGLWGCQNCRLKGDRFDMHGGVCRGK